MFVYDPLKHSYALGTSLTIEALLHIPDKIEAIYLSERVIRNEQYGKLMELCTRNKIRPVSDEKVIDRFSAKENCYAIAFFRRFSKPFNSTRHIALYNFSDPGELGTIFRSAVSFDLKDVALIDCKIDPLDYRTVRASMGSIFQLSITSYKSMEDYLKDNKTHLYPFISKGDKELKELEPELPYGLLIPQNATDLDSFFSEGYSLERKKESALSLSALSSIVFHYCFEKRNR